MIQRLSHYLDVCAGRAAAAERRAAVANDERARSDFLDLAKSWRYLTQCFLFVESLERFVTDAERAKNAQPPDPPAEDPLAEDPLTVGILLGGQRDQRRRV